MTGENEPASGTGKLTGSQVLGMLTGSMEGPAARFRVSRPCYRVARSWRELAYRAQRWQEEAREDAAKFPSYWQQRWPLPVRAALFPLGFAFSSVAWFLTDVADRLLPGAIDASAYWYNRRARKDNRKANEEPGKEGENGNQV